mmetsp:Transcript_38222/g.61328  ORF Transcript_38222/g.61328 Transcript_38222/m.61328 type:complete len:339 (+) Transcript_38222:1309-2325(+)
MEETIRALKQFWTAASEGSIDESVEIFRKELSSELWDTLGTKMFSTATLKKDAPFKKQVLKKKKTGFFKALGYTKRMFRIYVRRADSPSQLPTAVVSYFKIRKNQDEVKAKMSIPLCNAIIEIDPKDAKKLIIKQKESPEKPLIVRFENREGATEWQKALLNFVRTPDSEVQFARKILRILEKILSATNLADVLMNPQNDPLRPTFVLYGSHLLDHLEQIHEVRAQLNTAIINTFRKTLKHRHDGAFDLALNTILTLWASLLKETTSYYIRTGEEKLPSGGIKSNNSDYNFSATLTELAMHAENEESWSGTVSHAAQKSPSLRTPTGTTGGFHAALKR